MVVRGWKTPHFEAEIEAKKIVKKYWTPDGWLRRYGPRHFKKPNFWPILTPTIFYQNYSKIKGTPLEKNPPRQKLRFVTKKTVLILWDDWWSVVEAI